MRNLIEIHVLQNFVPSNLNRDDTGAPKDALFGGTRRARISSQCFKHAVRRHFTSMIEQGVLAEHQVGLRTKRLFELLVSELVQMGRSEEEARQKTFLALSAISLKIKENSKTEYLLFLGKSEIHEAARIINEQWDNIVIADDSSGESQTEEKSSKNKKVKKGIDDPASKNLSKALEKVFNGGKSLDVALFGRMLADMPAKNQYAACQVAHALSTHSVDREFDFYTAIDDLNPEEMTGAEMMGAIEFNAACFYRYANLDVDKLQANLQGDKDLALIGVKAFLEAFVIATPTGKQNSFAAHNPPEFVVVSVSQNAAPCNLANAFEAAINIRSDGSITGKSAKQLIKKAQSLHKAFGGERRIFVLNLTGLDLAGYGVEVSSLQELLDEIAVSVKE